VPFGYGKAREVEHCRTALSSHISAESAGSQGTEASSCSFTTPLGTFLSPSSRAEILQSNLTSPPTQTGEEAKITPGPDQKHEVMCFCQQFWDVGPRLYHKTEKALGVFPLFY